MSEAWPGAVIGPLCPPTGSNTRWKQLIRRGHTPRTVTTQTASFAVTVGLSDEFSFPPN